MGAKLVACGKAPACSCSRREGPRVESVARLPWDMPEGDRLIVFASSGGTPTHPDWYHNLLAHSHVTVEVGTQTFDAIAVVTAEEERDRLWTRGVALYPDLAEHQAKTTRQFPVIALSRPER